MANASGIPFSVIIPAYNAERTIARAIESCLNQSVTPYEIIVVDDHSTDDTLMVARRYQPKVTVIALPENLGPSQARNTGWEHATGDYVTFLDADDIWHADKLRIIQSALQLTEIPYFLFHAFDLKALPGEFETVPLARRFAFWSMVWRLPPIPCHPSTVAIKNVKEFRFEPTMRYMEDYDLWIRIAEKQPIYYLPLPLTQLGRPVLSEGGQSSNRLSMRLGEFKVYTRLVQRKPQYIPLFPILILWSSLKHIVKWISGK